MKKALIVMAVLAMVAPAMAGNLIIDDAIDWYGGWGDPATVVDNGGGSVTLSLPNGSSGIYWRMPAYDSEIVSITGMWEGNVGPAGWAEIMFFTSTEGLVHDDIVARLNASPADPLDVAAKHDSWDLGPSVWGPEPIEMAPYPGGGNFEIHATCAEVIIGLKIGGSGAAATATYDLTYVPEPASLMLVALGGLPLLLRRRR